MHPIKPAVANTMGIINELTGDGTSTTKRYTPKKQIIRLPINPMIALVFLFI